MFRVSFHPHTLAARFTVMKFILLATALGMAPTFWPDRAMAQQKSTIQADFLNVWSAFVTTCQRALSEVPDPVTPLEQLTGYESLSVARTPGQAYIGVEYTDAENIKYIGFQLSQVPGGKVITCTGAVSLAEDFNTSEFSRYFLGLVNGTSDIAAYGGRLSYDPAIPRSPSNQNYMYLVENVFPMQGAWVTLFFGEAQIILEFQAQL